MPGPKTNAPALDFGAQGGDPSRGVDMDLSTCVNRYGPAPAAIAALHAIDPAEIVLHPYDAAPQLIELYREATGVSRGAMIAGRGASEFIWAMCRELDHASVQVPMPAYTDYLKAFPGRGFDPGGSQIPSLEQIDSALNAAAVVIISNPHNPTGVHLDPDGLIAVAAAHPAATLVVDESYIDFTPDPAGWSVLGCELPNIVVLRSTTKFYGIAATRTGIAWCAESEPLAYLFGQQENWGLSGVDGGSRALLCATPIGPTAAVPRCTTTTPGWPRCCRAYAVSTCMQTRMCTSSSRSANARSRSPMCSSGMESVFVYWARRMACDPTRCASSHPVMTSGSVSSTP
jgi:hypothetical protein